jgi:hypothetical protein
MPTPKNLGDVAFREISRVEGVGSDGRSTVTIRRKGAASLIAAERAYLSALEFLPENPALLMESWSIDDSSPVITSEITFAGLTNENVGRVDISSRITQQTVKLTTSTGQEVSFRYSGQETTWTWRAIGTSRPRSPRFGSAPRTRFSADELMAPDPPNYTGTVAGRYRVVSVLSGFEISQSGNEGWVCVESWEQRVEPLKQT